jgi:pyruvate/2-oxoglutarate dehydrogenase complex dihydrolipoamide dehydrogenase (E3) component
MYNNGMTIPLLDHDSHDQILRQRVHPKNWVNPPPAPIYNLVVIGGGPAGLVTAVGAVGLGARVALIERDLLGGDCLNVGCVPSKVLLRAAKAADQARCQNNLGVSSTGVQVDFAAVMERVRAVRAELSRHDAAERFRSLGIDLFLGDAKFQADDAVQVNGVNLRFRRSVIATGARAASPQPGELTNESLFILTELPRRLLVVGAGPVGCELGQAFARLGSAVTLVAKTVPLPNEHPDASALLAKSLQNDRIQLVQERPANTDFDAVLLATGRLPNVETLNLAAAGIEYDATCGIHVDDYLRTTNSKVFAIGDVCSFGPRFTHAADAMARIVIQNSLFPTKRKVSALVIPHCTYTDPEIASVGEATGTPYRVEFAELDRAVTDAATDGFVEIRVKPGSDRIVGATAVGPCAGELIGTMSFAMTNRLGLKAFSSTVFPYPTYTEALRKAGDAYNRTRLTPFVAGVLKRWLRWNR